MTRPSWDDRIARAKDLAGLYSFAAEVLTFYASVAEFQQQLYRAIASFRRTPPTSFREGLDLEEAIGHFPAFLKMVERAGPAPLAAHAVQLAAEGRPRWEKLLTQFWTCGQEAELAQSFFARAFLQPCAENVAEFLGPPAAADGSTCPICDSEPVVAVLRPEGFGGKRSLICALCGMEWEYLRAMCPGCGEDNAESLCVYTAERFEHVRVDACETCKTYLKTVDLTKNGLAVPVVDEIATLPLTLWAQERGYSKLQPNLVAV